MEKKQSIKQIDLKRRKKRLDIKSKFVNSWYRIISIIILTILMIPMIFLNFMPMKSKNRITKEKKMAGKKETLTNLQAILYTIVFFCAVIFLIVSLNGINIFLLLGSIAITFICLIINDFFKDKSFIDYLYSIKPLYRILLLFSIFFTIFLGIILLINAILFIGNII